MDVTPTSVCCVPECNHTIWIATTSTITNCRYPTNLSSDSARKVALPSHFSSSSKMLNEDTESGFDTSWLSKKIVSRSAGRQLFSFHRREKYEYRSITCVKIKVSETFKSKHRRQNSKKIKTKQKRENWNNWVSFSVKKTAQKQIYESKTKSKSLLGILQI